MPPVLSDSTGRVFQRTLPVKEFLWQAAWFSKGDDARAKQKKLYCGPLWVMA